MVGTIIHPEPFLLLLKGILVMFVEGTSVLEIVRVYHARGIILNPFFVTVLGDFSGISMNLHITEFVEKRMELFEYMVRMDSVGIGAPLISAIIHEKNFKEDINFVTYFLSLGQRFTNRV